ncbi:helix-turn-helix domain-containing protein [Candidatus Scalindua japonica]|nr:helix-turn-helix domain-containing protein [Candidatus Scalindua japonica]
MEKDNQLFEKEIIRFTLEKTKGNKSKAARLPGFGLRTL